MQAWQKQPSDDITVSYTHFSGLPQIYYVLSMTMNSFTNQSNVRGGASRANLDYQSVFTPLVPGERGMAGSLGLQPCVVESCSDLYAFIVNCPPCTLQPSRDCNVYLYAPKASSFLHILLQTCFHPPLLPSVARDRFTAKMVRGV
jgi:hypothetical protein